MDSQGPGCDHRLNLEKGIQKDLVLDGLPWTQHRLWGTNSPAYFLALFFALAVGNTQICLYFEKWICLEVTMLHSSKTIPYYMQ